MLHLKARSPRSVLARTSLPAAMLAASFIPIAAASGQGFVPGNLLVSRSTYIENPALGLYPFVWNNDVTDPSFGITSKILLDQLTPSGIYVNTFEVPNSTQGLSPTANQMVTSFSSKSELALNLSTNGGAITFMGYVAPVNALDISNTNTPAAFDPTNPVTGTALRAVAQLDSRGNINFALTNAYSGNNGRAAIMFNNPLGPSEYFTAGNAGNGANPQPTGIVLGAGAQIIRPTDKAMSAQMPGLPTPVGSFSVTQLGAKPDKVGKDDNFRGLTIYNNVLYFTKGSGGNGVNTVYFLDTSGLACPNGVGIPARGARLPDAPLAYNPALLATQGLPSNMCILRGFPSKLNATLKKTTTAYPFGIWFASPTVVYVADEGDGDIADAGLTPAGLQKWMFDEDTETWTLAYTLQTGLGLGSTYPFPGDAAYPTGLNPTTGLPWAPMTDGLRNITGRVNEGGTVTIWGITSTVSGNGDQGADPNKLVAITDVISNRSPAVAALESFVTVRTAGFREVLRGVSFTPGTRR